MSVRKRKGSPFFWYSFNLNGRRFRGSTGKTAKREAEEVERAVYQQAKLVQRPKEDWTLQMVMSTYWTEHAQFKASAEMILRNFADLQRLLGKGTKTSELTNPDLIYYRAKRRGERRIGKDKKPIRQRPKDYTINRELAYLHAAFTHCHVLHGQPMPTIRWKELRAAEPPWRRRFLGRDDEAPALMNVMPQNVREIVICAIVTGLRKGNILRLDWSQVSLAERAITVRIKGNKEHVVRIPPALMAILSTKAKREGKVFDTTNFRRRWEASMKGAGLRNFRFHDLRHTFGSWARKNGVDLPTLKEAFNHSDISMTMRYANVEPDEVETTFDGVSATLLGTLAGTLPSKTAEN